MVCCYLVVNNFESQKYFVAGRDGCAKRSNVYAKGKIYEVVREMRVVYWL